MGYDIGHNMGYNIGYNMGCDMGYWAYACLTARYQKTSTPPKKTLCLQMLVRTLQNDLRNRLVKQHMFQLMLKTSPQEL